MRWGRGIYNVRWGVGCEGTMWWLDGLVQGLGAAVEGGWEWAGPGVDGGFCRCGGGLHGEGFMGTRGWLGSWEGGEMLGRRKGLAVGLGGEKGEARLAGGG